jgi:hypothetical protein
MQNAVNPELRYYLALEFSTRTREVTPLVSHARVAPGRSPLGRVSLCAGRARAPRVGGEGGSVGLRRAVLVHVLRGLQRTTADPRGFSMPPGSQRAPTIYEMGPNDSAVTSIGGSAGTGMSCIIMSRCQLHLQHPATAWVRVPTGQRGVTAEGTPRIELTGRRRGSPRRSSCGAALAPPQQFVSNAATMGREMFATSWGERLMACSLRTHATICMGFILRSAITTIALVTPASGSGCGHCAAPRRGSACTCARRCDPWPC